MRTEELLTKDIPEILDYVSLDPEINLFITGDIGSFGIDGRHVRVKGFRQENGALAGVLLRYMDRNYIFYSRHGTVPSELIASVVRMDNPSLKGVCVSGKSSLINSIAPFLPELHEEVTMMARCNEVKALPPSSSAEVRLLSEIDFDDYLGLIDNIAEFASFRHEESYDEQKDSWLASKKRGSATYGVYEKGLLVAIASSTADTAESAMLVGVCTREGYRCRGYASMAVNALLRDRFAKGKKFLCLFYDNPLAGAIYHRFGFVDIASYSMLH
jgi:Predicted acetyltransferase